MTTRAELRERVRRNLGHPMVKVELCDQHIDDAINIARDQWIRWAVGNSTEERYLTLLLLPGKWLYDLPAGVTEVVNYKDDFGGGGTMGSAHTYERGGPQELFTLDNAMYMSGFMNANMYGGSQTGIQAYNMINYEIARQTLGTMEYYWTNKYHWYYHKSTNQIEIKPQIPCDTQNYLTLEVTMDGKLTTMENPSCTEELSATTVQSPGFALLKVMMIEGSALPSYVPPSSGTTVRSIFNISENYSDYLFNEPWIIEYVTALSKITLGLIRRKFSSFSALGNASISMDGDSLMSEGKEEKKSLEDELVLKHAHTGYGVYLM